MQLGTQSVGRLGCGLKRGACIGVLGLKALDHRLVLCAHARACVVVLLAELRKCLLMLFFACGSRSFVRLLKVFQGATLLGFYTVHGRVLVLLVLRVDCDKLLGKCAMALGKGSLNVFELGTQSIQHRIRPRRGRRMRVGGRRGFSRRFRGRLQGRLRGRLGNGLGGCGGAACR